MFHREDDINQSQYEMMLQEKRSKVEKKKANIKSSIMNLNPFSDLMEIFKYLFFIKKHININK
jgi:hypothetical protein